MQVAHIIVDVPSMQTDTPYSYLVPEAFESLLSPGIRVHVPFGKANRLIQGIVLSLDQLEENESNPSLKGIVEILDYEPVLTAEQMWLADQMRREVFSYKITLLRAMLPSLLNSTYDKLLKATERLSLADKRELFGGKETLAFSDLDIASQSRMMRLSQAGQIDVCYVAKDKKQVKREVWFKVDQAALSALAISPRAKKKEEARAYLATMTHKAALSEFRRLFSREICRFFEDSPALILEEVEIRRTQSHFDSVVASQPLALSSEQSLAVNEISSDMGDKAMCYLLEGVTGSGKTEVYLHIIAKALEMGKTAIMLVPEISLTPQVTSRFIARFGKEVAIIHSGLSEGEKYDEWRKIKAGEAKVVVGARSAIFSPLKNIGVIIIDEEHEASYKQDSNPRYHAREVAKLRGRYHKAVLVLGSATPSLESRARAQKGVYGFLQLQHRANPKAQIPEVEVLDFRDYLGQMPSDSLTPPLLDKIREKLAKKEQVVLMLNRRGYSSFVICRECGSVEQCPNCDISLTFHMDTRTMNCHYCQYKKVLPHACSNCHSQALSYRGTGTQKIEEELMTCLPDAKILRMDVDTTRRKGAHKRLLTAFGNKEADILLGTQMIAKGLDFPDVTLVGVLNADTSLYLPDFRASERTFQLLTQVAGRAGRSDKKGEVLIQTYNPDHYAIQFAKHQDYEGFYSYELAVRHNLGYSPYYFEVAISLSHQLEETVIQKAYEVANFIKSRLSDAARLLGPTPKVISRTHNRYHYQLLILYRFEDGLEQALNDLLDWSQKKENKGLRMSIDQDPQS